MHFLSPSTSTLSIRGIKHTVYQWGDSNKPTLFMVHGWMDSGATFQFIAPYLVDNFHVIALDLRGYGNTEHVPTGYWFPDYLADLDAFLQHFSPDEPVKLAGHSMGANISSMYSGLKTDRVAKLMLLDWVGLTDTTSEDTPKRYLSWMNEVAADEETKIYKDVEQLKKSMRVGNPSFSEEIIEALIPIWAVPVGNSGQMKLRADHNHRRVNPYRYNLTDMLMILRQVEAQVAMLMASNGIFTKKPDYEERIKLLRDTLKVSDNNFNVVSNSAHMLHIERPEETAKHITQFFS
jgi:pimeloyl-ACP methyl ester carboxylesterase